MKKLATLFVLFVALLLTSSIGFSAKMPIDDNDGQGSTSIQNTEIVDADSEFSYIIVDSNTVSPNSISKKMMIDNPDEGSGSGPSDTNINPQTEPTPVVTETSSSSSSSRKKYNLGSMSSYEVNGYSRGDIAIFTINGEQHTARIGYIGNDYTMLTISSTPFDTKLYTSDISEFDLDNDGVNDLRVWLSGIVSNKAFLSFSEIALEEQNVAEPVLQFDSAPVKAMEESVVVSDEQTGQESVTGSAVREQSNRGSLAAWITGLALLAIAISGYFLSNRKR